MSHFDDWLSDYFSREDEGRIRSIGCWSYGSSMKKSRKELREQLKAAGMEDFRIEEFILGVYGETDFSSGWWRD